MRTRKAKSPHVYFSAPLWGAAFLILFLLVPGTLESREFFLEPWGCYLDLPQGWEPLEVSDTKATFADEGAHAFFQVHAYPATRYAGGEEMFQDVGDRLKADGEGELFNYQGNEAVLTDLLFQGGSTFFKGWGLYVDGTEFDWVILGFATAELSEAYHVPLLSALDSFSLNDRALLSPGPVSQFYASTATDSEEFDFEVPFEDHMLQVITTDADVEASRVTLEREARVLALYTPEDIDAWQRFYRMLYRDSYRKVDSLFRSLIMAGISPRQDPLLTAKTLLSWIQGFGCARTGGLEDLSLPLDSLYNGAGDCDSLGLLYVILLKHYGIDAILMVSGTYSHAMAAVDVEAPGARFEWEGRKYLVAETIYEVDLGLIAADMADPAHWMGITFLPEIP